jgi:ABC-type antimicrobial peptide transport system permease subunit
MDDVIADELAPRQFRMRLVGLFALLAVGLAAVGIYGVISYSVTRRAREFGLRMALGAPPSYILKLVARQGALLTGIGLVLGVAGALGLSRVMSSLLYGVNPRDPLTFAAVTVILSAIALAASYVPAYRAAKVDPVVALRHE